MCVIFQLLPGYTIPKPYLDNAVHNNPHGYGIIIKRDNKLTVVKDLPAGGNDPDVIYKILKDNEDAERYCHVRWKTAGAISDANTQPFLVFDDSGREIWFCHNGTLSQYTPTYSQNPPPDEASDSRKFAETILKRYLPKMTGENGIADYQDEIIQDMLLKTWPTHGSKGLLIGNDLDPLFLGYSQWDDIKTTERVETEDGVTEVSGSFFASNNDYFERLKRGPLHDKLEEEKREKDRQEREARNASGPFGRQTSLVSTSIAPITSPPFFEKYSLGEGIVDLLEDFDLYKTEGYVALANVSYADWRTYITKISNDDMCSLLLYLTDFLRIHVENNTMLEEKHVEFVEKIETLEKQIERMAAEKEAKKKVSKITEGKANAA